MLHYVPSYCPTKPCCIWWPPDWPLPVPTWGQAPEPLQLTSRDDLRKLVHRMNVMLTEHYDRFNYDSIGVWLRFWREYCAACRGGERSEEAEDSGSRGGDFSEEAHCSGGVGGERSEEAEVSTLGRGGESSEEAESNIGGRGDELSVEVNDYRGRGGEWSGEMGGAVLRGAEMTEETDSSGDQALAEVSIGGRGVERSEEVEVNIGGRGDQRSEVDDDYGGLGGEMSEEDEDYGCLGGEMSKEDDNYGGLGGGMSEETGGAVLGGTEMPEDTDITRGLGGKPSEGTYCYGAGMSPEQFDLWRRAFLVDPGDEEHLTCAGLSAKFLEQLSLQDRRLADHMYRVSVEDEMINPVWYTSLQRPPFFNENDHTLLACRFYIVSPSETISVPEKPVYVPKVPTSVPEVPISVPKALISVPKVPISVPEVPTSVPEVPTSVPEVPISVPEVPVCEMNGVVLIDSGLHIPRAVVVLNDKKPPHTGKLRVGCVSGMTTHRYELSPNGRFLFNYIEEWKRNRDNGSRQCDAVIAWNSGGKEDQEHFEIILDQEQKCSGTILQDQDKCPKTVPNHEKKCSRIILQDQEKCLETALDNDRNCYGTILQDQEHSGTALDQEQKCSRTIINNREKYSEVILHQDHLGQDGHTRDVEQLLKIEKNQNSPSNHSDNDCNHSMVNTSRKKHKFKSSSHQTESNGTNFKTDYIRANKAVRRSISCMYIGERFLGAYHYAEHRNIFCPLHAIIRRCGCGKPRCGLYFVADERLLKSCASERHVTLFWCECVGIAARPVQKIQVLLAELHMYSHKVKYARNTNHIDQYEAETINNNCRQSFIHRAEDDRGRVCELDTDKVGWWLDRLRSELGWEPQRWQRTLRDIADALSDDIFLINLRNTDQQILDLSKDN